MYPQVCFFLLVLLTSTTLAQKSIIIGQRFQIESEVLQEERSYQIYLPPSYYTSPQQQFPVLYVIDGDYNFRYLTGLVEQLSETSESIPELIVVGISDRGQQNYIKNLTPTIDEPKEGEQSGRATLFLQFLAEELKPKIQKDYRAASFDILTGHSIGGLFVVNSLLTRPEVFDAYIAISPSMWWNEYAVSKWAGAALAKEKDWNKFLYLTLANEQQMGVIGLIDVLDRQAPAGLDWTFKHLPEENHGSVAVPTIRMSLKQLFKGYEVRAEQFYSFKDFQAVSDYYQGLAKKWNYALSLPPRSFGNMVHFYYRKARWKDLEDMQSQIAQHFPASLEMVQAQIAKTYVRNKDLEKAKKLYLQFCKEHPQSFQLHHGFAQLYETLEDHSKALEHYQKAIDLARKQQVRQWVLNYLLADQQTFIEKAKK